MVTASDGQDPRAHRSWLRLSEAIIALASQQDIASISVAALTRHADVNRSTFYAHAQTPTELLARVLAADLDDLRSRNIERLDREGCVLRGPIIRTLREVVDHVLKFEQVYGGTSRNSSMFALRCVLAEHVGQSILMMLREGFVLPPVAGEAASEMHAAFIAHGIAAVVEVWLSLPAPRDDAILIAAIETSLPPWYVRPSGRLSAQPEHHTGEIL